MTEKQMAQMALDVQSACNLSGVVRSFAEVTMALRKAGIHTESCNQHPVSQLFAAHIIDLTRMGIADHEAYHRAYTECKRMASEPDPEPDPPSGLPPYPANWTIVVRKRRNANCDYVVIDRGEAYTNASRWVAATVTSESINNNEWFWGHYFATQIEAIEYFNAQE
jgi:hypothetical protein